ncbi:type II toxin-antitoxin system VapC family toxin [Pseudomonas sp. App30]|uniref:type II toxin-antitoxin system VapC family toxin n=1 Tax=Pseudomonas sp. App30 TaxID=3068990 RepID=UPI003A812B6A
MIVLDTNVLSELMRPAPAANVLEWLDNQDAGDLATTSITVAEVLFGLACLPSGQRKVRLQTQAIAMFNDDFADAILSFDADAAMAYAALIANSRAAGRAVSMADGQIAAICASRKVTLATRNTKDFQHLPIELINPWEPMR